MIKTTLPTLGMASVKLKSMSATVFKCCKLVAKEFPSPAVGLFPGFKKMYSLAQLLLQLRRMILSRHVHNLMTNMTNVHTDGHSVESLLTDSPYSFQVHNWEWFTGGFNLD